MFCVRGQRSGSLRALSPGMCVLKCWNPCHGGWGLAAGLRGFNSLLGQFKGGAARHMIHTHCALTTIWTSAHGETHADWQRGAKHKFAKCHATDDVLSHTGCTAGKQSTQSDPPGQWTSVPHVHCWPEWCCKSDLWKFVPCSIFKHPYVFVRLEPTATKEPVIDPENESVQWKTSAEMAPASFGATTPVKVTSTKMVCPPDGLRLMSKHLITLQQQFLWEKLGISPERSRTQQRSVTVSARALSARRRRKDWITNLDLYLLNI